MKERSLIAFTLGSQMAVGAFWVLGALHVWATRRAGPMAAGELTDRVFLAILPLMVLGMLAPFFHLGVPLNSWRVFANLHSSWLSREVLLAVLFTGFSGLFAGLRWFELGTATGRDLVAWAAALLGLGMIFGMANAYRLRTVPAWDTWVTPVSFFITAFLLGALAVGAWLAVDANVPRELAHSSLRWIAVSAVVLLGTQLLIISLWIVALATGKGAALRSAARITQERSLVFRLRLALAAAAILVSGIALSPWGGGAKIEVATVVAFGLVLAAEVLGRLLFFEARVRHGV